MSLTVNSILLSAVYFWSEVLDVAALARLDVIKCFSKLHFRKADLEVCNEDVLSL